MGNTTIQSREGGGTRRQELLELKLSKRKFLEAPRTPIGRLANFNPADRFSLTIGRFVTAKAQSHPSGVRAELASRSSEFVTHPPATMQCDTLGLVKTRQSL